VGAGRGSSRLTRAGIGRIMLSIQGMMTAKEIVEKLTVKVLKEA